MMATAAPAQRTRESSYAEVRDLYLSRDIRLLRTEDRDPTRTNPVHLVCVHLNKGYYLEGRIDVANIAFEKDVSLHVSWDNWQTSHDIAATYISSHENNRNAEIAALQDAASRTARTIEAPLNDEDVGGYARRVTLQGTLDEAAVEKGEPATPEPPVDRFFFRLHLLPFLRSASGAGHVTHLEFQLCAKFSAPAVGGEWWDSNYGANYRCTARFPSAYEASLVREFLPGYGLPQIKQGAQKSAINRRYDTIDRLTDRYRASLASPTSKSGPSPPASPVESKLNTSNGSSYFDGWNESKSAESEGFLVPTKGTCECEDQ